MGFEPGWLMKTCREAHIDVMRDNSPAALKHLGVDAVCTDAEAFELVVKMEVRFWEWTGKSIADFLEKPSG
jgi:hypothetical protein